MEHEQTTPEQTQNKVETIRTNKRYNIGRVLSGFILLAVGIILLLKQLGFELPYWLFTWPMLLIVIGFFVGARHGYHSNKWLIVVLIGVLFLIDKTIPGINISHFIWPIIIMTAGLMIIFRPRKKRLRDEHWRKWWEEQRYNKQEYRKHKFDKYRDYHYDYKQYTMPNDDKTGEDFINSTTIFGGIEKSVLSKTFKGGEIVNICGGTELNLSQADIEGKVVLDITQVLGGTKLIVPSHWEIKSEMMVAVFGGLEDKRAIKPETTIDTTKILVIKGISVFGGISISNF